MRVAGLQKGIDPTRAQFFAAKNNGRHESAYHYFLGIKVSLMDKFQEPEMISLLSTIHFFAQENNASDMD